MQIDKYTSVWVSHSSINDYLHCPRAYYYNNIFRHPKSGNKISVMQPPLALGQAVHEVVESLSVLPTDKRFEEPLIAKFEKAWEKVNGKKGGFFNEESEKEYKARGAEMIKRVSQNPGLLARKAVKIKMDLPHYVLSEEDGIILCGKIDWLEYLEDTESVHIVDFKTGRQNEKEDSLQLPIYLLLVEKTQAWPVTKVSYWYLERKNSLTEMKLPDREEAHERVLKVAKRIKLARKLNKFECQNPGNCRYCRPFEAVLAGEAELVGVSEYRQDIYVLPVKETQIGGQIL